jgi:hypothetical protein
MGPDPPLCHVRFKQSRSPADIRRERRCGAMKTQSHWQPDAGQRVKARWLEPQFSHVVPAFSARDEVPNAAPLLRPESPHLPIVRRLL